MTPFERCARVRLDGAALADDENGQISAVGVLAAAAFACLLLLVVNTGFTTNGKIEMQNAADATAISGATWIARGLNVISMNNVTQTQILAVVLVIRALDDALPRALGVLKAELKACGLLAVGAPVCAAIIGFQIQALTAIQTAVQAVGRPLVRFDGPLWRAMIALELVSDVVAKSFVAVAEIEADRIARQNGADLGFIVTGGLRLTLPVRKGALRPDLCDPTRRGSPAANSRGYTPLLKYGVNEGPFERYSRQLGYGFIPFENSLIRVFFGIARESHYRSLCGGSGGGSTLPPERQAGSLEQCRLAGGGTATWAIVKDPNDCICLPATGHCASRRQGPEARRPAARSRPATAALLWMDASRCANRRREIPVEREIVEQAGTDANGNPIRRYRYEFTDYLFLSASVPQRTSPDPGVPLPTGSASASNPDPYLLTSNARDDLRYLAVTYRSSDDLAAPRYFASPLGTHRVAYTQARVHNPTAFDTFTQDWRVTLEPASLIEDGTLLGAIGSPVLQLVHVRNGQALNGFRASSGLFDGLRRDLNLVRYFNNH